jgi:hypothetical protein
MDGIGREVARWYSSPICLIVRESEISANSRCKHLSRFWNTRVNYTKFIHVLNYNRIAVRCAYFKNSCHDTSNVLRGLESEVEVVSYLVQNKDLAPSVVEATGKLLTNN